MLTLVCYGTQEENQTGAYSCASASKRSCKRFQCFLRAKSAGHDTSPTAVTNRTTEALASPNNMVVFSL